MGRFPEFAGRTREKERVWALISAKWKELAVNEDKWLYEDGKSLDFIADVKRFIDQYYDDQVPYHGPVHVLYGIIYLLELCEKGLAFVDITRMMLWLGHDAGHNGNSAESPEEKSMKISKQEMAKIRPTVFRESDLSFFNILQTKFPYDRKPLPQYSAGAFLRVVDSLRIAAGDIEAKYLGLEKVDPFLLYMYESGGLWLELGQDLETWLRNGQSGFFFPHLRDYMHKVAFEFYFNANVPDKQYEFFEGSDKSDYVLVHKLMFVVWKNHERLMQIVGDNAELQKLLDLINWSMKNDCTLPEYLAKAKELGL